MKITFNVTREWLEKRIKEYDASGVVAGSTLLVEVETNSLPAGLYNPQGEVAHRPVGATVRAKMICSEMVTYAGGGTKVKLGAVYSNDLNSENRAFSDATPSGSCEMMIQGGRPAIKLFEAGAEYFLDFTKVQK